MSREDAQVRARRDLTMHDVQVSSATSLTTRPILEDLRSHVPRRIDHFQGELSELEAFVVARIDGRRDLEQLAALVGLSVREVLAIVLVLSGNGAIVVRAPSVRKISGVRQKAQSCEDAIDAIEEVHELEEIDVLFEDDVEAAVSLRISEREPLPSTRRAQVFTMQTVPGAMQAITLEEAERRIAGLSTEERRVQPRLTLPAHLEPLEAVGTPRRR